MGSFDLNEIVTNSDNVILKYPAIQYLISLLIVVVAVIIIILSYQRKTDSLMLRASQYISEYTHDGIIITDHKRRAIYCNNVFEDSFGLFLEDIKGRKISDFFTGGKRKSFYLSEMGNHPGKATYGAGGRRHYILKYLKIKHIRNKKNDLGYYIGIYSEPKVDQKVLDEATWDELSVGHVESNLLLGAEPVLNKGFDVNAEYIVVVIKISEFIDINTVYVKGKGTASF